MMAQPTTKEIFLHLSRAEVGEKLLALDVPQAQVNMRRAQMWRGAYVDGVQNFSSLTTLAKPLREKLDETFCLNRLAVHKALVSTDGTRKWLLELKDKGSIEMVFIPEEEKGRGTLCLSSQIGCTLTCRFCRTGTQAWQRNLTAGEIIGQVALAFDALDAWQHNNRPITNIVFMGQGEPLLNLDNTIKAIKILTDPDGFAFSKRKITVSTAGFVPGIKRLGEETGVCLALSLHASEDEKRQKLVPLNNKYNIAELLAAVRAYADIVKGERITFEYVMLEGINDQEEDAKKLVQRIKGIPSKINLIPFNGWEGAPFTPTSQKQIEKFSALLNRAGYAAPVRRARGADIMAACGQLKTQSEITPKAGTRHAK